jgi:serine/threonine protein kinase
LQAPELLDDSKYNEKVDVYAFAMVIFETFAKEMPWNGLNQGMIAMQVGSRTIVVL